MSRGAGRKLFTELSPLPGARLAVSNGEAACNQPVASSDNLELPSDAVTDERLPISGLGIPLGGSRPIPSEPNGGAARTGVTARRDAHPISTLLINAAHRVFDKDEYEQFKSVIARVSG